MTPQAVTLLVGIYLAFGYLVLNYERHHTTEKGIALFIVVAWPVVLLKWLFEARERRAKMLQKYEKLLKK